jgi:hypothetical protein
MTFSRHCFVALLLSAAWATLSAAEEPAPEVPAFVNDAAGLFSPKTVQEADQLIAGHEVGLYVDTVKELPAERRKSLKYLYAPPRAAFYRQCALERAKDRDARSNVDGIYVFICENPKVTVVIPYPEEREHYFSYSDCDQIRRTFVNRLNQAIRDGESHPADAALLALANAFNARLRENGPVRQPVKPSLLALVIVLAALFALAGVLALMTRRSGQRRARSRPYLPDESPAVLGTLFGSVSAWWVYDSLLKPRPPTQRPRTSVSQDGARAGASGTVPLTPPGLDPTRL